MNSLVLADVVSGPLGGSALSSWIIMLGMTIAIELSVVSLVWRLTGRFGALKRWCLAGAVGNTVSHPIATYVWINLPVLTRIETMMAFAMIEVIVTVFEAWVYQRMVRCPAAIALLVSACANGVTAAIALMLGAVR